LILLEKAQLLHCAFSINQTHHYEKNDLINELLEKSISFVTELK